MDYKKIMDEILELTDKYLVVSGYSRVAKNPDGMFNFVVDDFNEDSIYSSIGNYDFLMVKYALTIDKEYDQIESPGMYYFRAILTCVPSEYIEDGFIGMDQYYFVKHIEFNKEI